MRDKKRIILHVDMDHFFSAIEERENPSFKGNPVVVGADPKRGLSRGVVKTCNYEARKFGIHSGMPIVKAWKLCPKAIYVKSNYALYRQVSTNIMKVLSRYSEKLQQWGLDEAFLDITEHVSAFEDAKVIAENIKHEIIWQENLICSIGVAPNKLVAKIASDFKKPDGLTMVDEDSIENFLMPLPVRKMLWIGKKTEQKMKKMGIKTIGDLASHDVSILIGKFGVMGARYHQYAHGLYDSEIGGVRGRRKSIGHESTFQTDIDDYTLILNRLEELCQKIYKRLTKHNIIFKTVSIKIRYKNFLSHSHSFTLSHFTNNLQDLLKITQRLVKNNLCKNTKIRLIGVRISNLESWKGQRTLQNLRKKTFN